MIGRLKQEKGQLLYAIIKDHAVNRDNRAAECGEVHSF